MGVVKTCRGVIHTIRSTLVVYSDIPTNHGLNCPSNTSPLALPVVDRNCSISQGSYPRIPLPLSTEKVDQSYEIPLAEISSGRAVSWRIGQTYTVVSPRLSSTRTHCKVTTRLSRASLSTASEAFDAASINIIDSRICAINLKQPTVLLSVLRGAREGRVVLLGAAVVPPVWRW